MPLVVQKFGGTSVADPERIREVADHVARTKRRGDTVGPLVYFNFEPTYDEAEAVVVSYVSGDDRFASVLGGGWVRERDTDPRPDPLEWSLVYGTFQAARAAGLAE